MKYCLNFGSHFKKVVKGVNLYKFMVQVDPRSQTQVAETLEENKKIKKNLKTHSFSLDIWQELYVAVGQKDS